MRNELFNLFQHVALTPTGIRSKLVWAFILMSVIPLAMLVLVTAWFAFPHVREFYHLERWFPLIANPSESTWWLIGLIGLTMLISLLGGLYLTVKIISPVIHISHGAKQLAEGQYDHPLPVQEDDELGDLSHALNQLTRRIRTNMVELKQFGEQTTQMNLEIHKRVLILSGLLQVGELISGGAELDVVLDLVVERLAALNDYGFSFLCLQPMEELQVNLRRAQGVDPKLLAGLPFDSASTLVDGQHPPTPQMQGAWEQLERPNLARQPILVRGRLVGVLGVGNRMPGFTWSPELIDLAAVFAKQASIALENELLLRKTKALAIHDELTGAFTEAHIRQRLEEELKRAVMYQRPCALAMFVIPDLGDYRKRRGEPEAERAIKKVARLVQESVTAIDRVGRFNGNEIVALLPERNKRQAVEITEEIRRRVAFAFGDVSDPRDRLTVACGVAENPLDGVTGEELIEKATAMVQSAALAGLTSGGAA